MGASLSRELRTPLVVIVQEELERASKGPLILHYHVIETLPPKSANQALHERVLPRSLGPLQIRESSTQKSRSARLSRSRGGAVCWRTVSWWRRPRISTSSSARVRRLDRTAARKP